MCVSTAHVRHASATYVLTGLDNTLFRSFEIEDLALDLLVQNFPCRRQPVQLGV
jgi:hypothetical protein